MKEEKIKKILQEYFGERPTQLHTSRELTKVQMRPEESILVFNDRYTVLLEESLDEIPEMCSSKIIIVHTLMHYMMTLAENWDPTSQNLRMTYKSRHPIYTKVGLTSKLMIQNPTSHMSNPAQQTNFQSSMMSHQAEKMGLHLKFW